METMLLPLRRYADFEGRSRRSEYWLFMLFYILVLFALGIVMVTGIAMNGGGDPMAGGPGSILFWAALGLMGLFVLAMLVPSIAVQVRRFHDQDKSGWMVLISFVPYVGGLIVLVFMCLEGTRGPNRFGPDPKQSAEHLGDVFS